MPRFEQLTEEQQAKVRASFEGAGPGDPYEYTVASGVVVSRHYEMRRTWGPEARVRIPGTPLLGRNTLRREERPGEERHFDDVLGPRRGRTAAAGPPVEGGGSAWADASTATPREDVEAAFDMLEREAPPLTRGAVREQRRRLLGEERCAECGRESGHTWHTQNLELPNAHDYRDPALWERQGARLVRRGGEGDA